MRRAGRVADWMSMLSPSRNSGAVPTPVRRIGVVLEWGIGDAVLATPLLRALRAMYPDASLELIGKPWLRELLGDTGLADRVHELTPPWTRYTRKYRFWGGEWRSFGRALLELRRRPFDILVGARYDPRETLQIRVLKGRLRVGYGRLAGRGWLDRDLGTPPHLASNTHSAVTAARTAEALTGRPIDPTPRLPVAGAMVEKAAAVLEEAGYTGGHILAVCVEAGQPIREWRTEGFEDVLRTLPAGIGLIVRVVEPGRPVEPLALPEHIPSIQWKTGLRELCGLLSIADLLLCSDSGVMHMAAACGCRVVAVFGPTSPAWFGPSGESDEVVMIEPMPCRPCLDLCIYPRPICMDRVAPAMVSRAVARGLSALGAPRMLARAAAVFPSR